MLRGNQGGGDRLPNGERNVVRADGGRTEDSGNDGAGGENERAGGSADDADGNDDEAGGNTGDASEGASGENERQIYHRTVTPDADEANQRLLRLVANLEHCEVIDLPPLYGQVDHLVEQLFTEPPPAEAQVELEFSYHGYRIELDQTGEVTFIKIDDDASAASEE